MKKFEEYFSFKDILGDLIRWRVKGQDVDKTLPPRREWCRDKVQRRKRLSNEEVHQRAIWRKVIVVREQGRLEDYKWGRALRKLVNDVQSAVFSGDVSFQKPTLLDVPKGYENGIAQYRKVAKFERLADRVILNRTRIYVRDVLEDILGDCCYSYRRDAGITHQTAIRALQEWRGKHAAATMFVAECDIQKFFDKISHDVVRHRGNEVGFAPLAGKVLDAYLAVYSHSDSERRGLPQGGSLSTVLANLVLAAADNAVNLIAFAQQQLCQIRSILSGDPGNQCFFHAVFLISLFSLRTNCTRGTYNGNCTINQKSFEQFTFLEEFRLINQMIHCQTLHNSDICHLFYENSAENIMIMLVYSAGNFPVQFIL